MNKSERTLRVNTRIAPLVSIILGAVAFTGFFSCKQKYIEASPKMAPVTEAVFASGSIEPVDAYTLTSISDGYITKAYVQENDLVKDGQILFRIDSRQQHTQVDIAQNNLRYAQISAAENSPNVLQIKAQIEASKLKMMNDSVTFSRYQKLIKTHSVSQQDYDNAQLNYQSSTNTYKANMENLRVTLNSLRQNLENTKAQLSNAQAGFQYFDLTSIGSSKVYQIFKKQGDFVKKGDQVAQLGNPDSIVVKLDVDESNIAKIKLGQVVLVELNTEKNVTYEASISKIYPHFNDQSQSYKVEARFKKDMSQLISGTQLQANIVISKKESALLIPHAYVMNGNRVKVLKNDKVDTVSITPGIVSDEYIEVLSGLTTTDKLIK